MEQTPIKVSNLVRHFGMRTAVDGIDFDLAPGRISGLVGPNGSGKTTLLKLLAGFLKPDRGQVRVFGLDPFRSRAKIMRRTRFAFAPPALFDSLTAREHLVHLGGMGNGGKPSATAVERTIETVGLNGRADEPVRAFSFGMRQRLGLAQALLPRPELLVLDEPTDGLDPLAVLELREVLRRLRDDEGIAILLSSHLLVEVDRLVDEMLVLREGRCLFRGPPAELRQNGKQLVLETSDNQRAMVHLRGQGFEVSHAPSGSLVMAEGAIELDRASKLLQKEGISLIGFHVELPTLETALLERLRDSDPSLR